MHCSYNVHKATNNTYRKRDGEEGGKEERKKGKKEERRKGGKGEFRKEL